MPSFLPSLKKLPGIAWTAGKKSRLFFTGGLRPPDAPSKKASGLRDWLDRHLENVWLSLLDWKSVIQDLWAAWLMHGQLSCSLLWQTFFWLLPLTFYCHFVEALSESGVKKWGVNQILDDDSELDSPIWHHTSFFYPHFQKVLQKSEWFQQSIFLK